MEAIVFHVDAFSGQEARTHSELGIKAARLRAVRARFIFPQKKNKEVSAERTTEE